MPILRQIYLTLRSKWYRRRPHLVGTDEYGNRFFEAAPNKGSEHPSRSSRPQRFVLVPGQKTVDDPWMDLTGELPNMSVEWASWLGHRRSNPPTQAEIDANAAATKRRQDLAAQLEISYEKERAEMIREGLLHDDNQSKDPSSRPNPKAKVAFPTRPELEVVPGEGYAGSSYATKKTRKSDGPEEGRRTS